MLYKIDHARRRTARKKKHTIPIRKPVIHQYKLKRVALYCRISTKMERQLNSLSAQMYFEKQDILDHPLWEYVDTYSDIKSGRTINSRPRFKKMITDCKAGKIGLIYTKSISRFGRNCVDFLVTLRELKELKVDVYFQNKDIFLLSENERITFNSPLCPRSSRERK